VVFSFPVCLPGPPLELSAAERAVVTAALAGKTNGEIGRERRTSARTIANQLASAYRKIGVQSRGELAARLLDGA
jgi:DNA-binding CsgD family transcriptional regulator